MNKISITIIAIIILVSGCIENKEENLHLETYEIEKGSQIFQVKKNGNAILNIKINKSGELDYISNITKLGYEQLIYFHESDGAIKSKIKLDTSDNTIGRAYYFYKNSGDLSSDYNYIDGVKVGSAVSYHESSDHVKEVMLYNKEGNLLHRKTFDWEGNLVKEEGSKK